MDFFLLLLLKHAIVDLGIQSQLKDIKKDKYFGNGHIHYIQHGIGTLIVGALFLQIVPAILCAVLDYVIHWHIDYGKHKINKIFKIESRTTAWWWTNVTDQCLHFITYYCLAKYINVLFFLLLILFQDDLGVMFG